jgi:hypothetical protein
MIANDDELTSAKIAMELLGQAEQFDSLVVIYRKKDKCYGFYKAVNTSDVSALGLATYFKGFMLKTMLDDDEEPS